MKVQNRKSKTKLNILAAFLLCGIFLAVTFGSAYAHYETSIPKEFELQYKAETGQMYIRSIDSAETEKVEEDDENSEITEDDDVTEDVANNVFENAYSAHFVLANGNGYDDYCEYDQKATLSMVATIGLGNPNDYIVMLVDGGISYTAICTEVQEGTERYNVYGPGWVYRFYNSVGEEVEWQFPGTQYIERKMEIIVIGASEMPVALNLIVKAKPGE